MSAPRILAVHPDDVNLADVKAYAALHNVNVVGNPFVPRGWSFLMRPDWGMEFTDS